MKKLLLMILLLSSFAFLFAGVPHPVYVELVNQSGEHPDTATFNAWIVGRESEVLTETSAGCSYHGDEGDPYKGSACIQCSTFPTDWQAGDVLHVEATTPLGNGSGEFTLNTAGFQFFGDMYGTWSEGPGITLIPQGPDPIDIPAGEEGAGDTVTPNNDVGTYVDDGYGRSDLENAGFNNFTGMYDPDNIGIFTIITLDDASPVQVTITLDGISYDPWDFGYYTNGHWHMYPHGTFTWNNHSVTFTVEFNTKGNVDVPIAFAKGSTEDNALPVVLAQFTVKQLAQFAQITWTTQSETNMIGYRVWRATVQNLDKAQPVSSLINATNQTEGHSYSFTDKNVQSNNTYYYWLEAQNYDGSNHFYQLGDVTIEPNQTPILPQVSVLSQNYPNPFNPETNIKFSVKEGETGVLTIYNQKGQVVLRKTFEAGNHEYTFDGTKYSSGIYFYKLQTPTYSKINKMIMLK